MTSTHDDRHWRDLVNGLMLLASSSESRGEYDFALTTIQQAIELVEAQRLKSNDQDVELMYWHALMLCGSLQRQLANYPQAEVTLQHALEVAIAAFGEVDDATSLARNQLGVLYKYTGEFEKGEKLYRDALENLIDKHSESNTRVALLYHNLGGLFHARGDFARGEPYARKAWDINRQLLGLNIPPRLRMPQHMQVCSMA